jgi:hypothetical protein
MKTINKITIDTMLEFLSILKHINYLTRQLLFIEFLRKSHSFQPKRGGSQG